MNRIAFLFLLLPAGLWALCPSNVRVEATDSSLHVELSTDVPGRTTRARLRYGVGPDLTTQGSPASANNPTAASRVINVTDVLSGVEKLYFDPQVSDLQGERWSNYASCQEQLCPSAGAQPGGYSCEADGKGALIPYVSTPADAGALAPPEPPRHTRANPRERPAINGKVTKLSDCSAVQQTLNDHAAGGTKDPNLNHEIRLQPGLICRPEQESSGAGRNLVSYTLPPKRGSGVTVITCDWGPMEAPPPGVQYTPQLRTARSCGFGLNHETVGPGSPFEANGALFAAAKCPDPPCTQGWRFETLVMETGDWRAFSPRKVAVESVDLATGRFRVAESIDHLFATNTEMVVNLPGVQTMAPGPGAKQHMDYNQRACMAARYSSQEIGCWGVKRMTGKYEGGGYVTAAQGYEIESCQAAANTVSCTLQEPHGLGNFYPFPIASLRGGELEVGAEAHGWTKGGAVVVEGSSGCDGIYNVERVTGPNAVKLARTVCTGTGGVVRRLYTGRFFDLRGAGASALEGVHLIDFPGPKQVRAFDVAAAGAAIESGGFVYSNPKAANFFSLSNVAGITWDRVLFDISLPFRFFNLIGIGNRAQPDLPCDCALLDSFVEGLQFWLPITPGSQVVDAAQALAPFSAGSTMLRAHVVKDLHIDGVTLRSSAAFAFFSDQFGVPGPQDVTFRRISTTLPDELVAGRSSKGMAYNLRHFIEVKAGVRLLLEGLQVQDWAAVGVSGASPIFFSYRTTELGGTRLMQDLTLRNIFMRNVPVGIAIRTGVDGAAAHRPVRRVLIDNVLIDGVDYPNRQAAPHDQTLGVRGTFFDTPVGSGSALAIGGPAEDVRVTRVTARRLRSKNVPNFLWMMDGRVNGFQVDRSIISYSPAGAEQNGVAAYGYSTKNLVPPVGGGGSKAFLDWTTRMGEPDPRSWFGTASAPVGVIPCLPDSNTPTPAFDRKNNVKSLAERAFACAGKDCGRWNVLLAGGDRQSCAEREALTLGPDLEGIGPFKGLGADTKELARALGYFPAQVMEIGPTSGNLVYAPLSAESCTVDHSGDKDFKTFIRGKDQGGEGNRAMLLGGYAPGDIAYYRLLCPQSIQIWGRFQTKAE